MNKVSIIFFILFATLSLAIAGVKPIDNSEIKCGTFADEKKLNHFYNRILSPVDTIKGRPILSFSHESKSKIFLIHYDTLGYHKVSTEDKNNNFIPDYIELVSHYIDSVYKIQVLNMGYRKPEIDSGLGGSDAYDIYVMNIGHDSEDRVYYGVTRKDFKVKANSKLPLFATHLIIDNDYGPYDSLTTEIGRRQTFSMYGEPLLKITLAHEFHHAIQLSYGEEDDFTNTHILNEMTSTWMEYRCFPDVKDYIQYVNSLFISPDKYPFGAGSSNSGYNWSIFGQYLYKNFGDNALLRTWELVGSGFNVYLALDSALKEFGTTLEFSWCDFSNWLYYTGTRAGEKSYFDDAELFPDFSPKTKIAFSNPAVISSGITQAFEMRSVRIFLPPQGETSLDTIDIFIANTDLFAASKKIPSNKNYTLTLSKSPANNCKEIENSGYYYGLTAPNGNICGNTFFVLSEPAGYAFPNPFSDLKYEYLYLSVPANSSLNGEVVLRMFNSDMTEIYSEKKKVQSLKNDFDDKLSKRVVELEGYKLKHFENGIYIFTVEFGDETIIGKFTLLR